MSEGLYEGDDLQAEILTELEEVRDLLEGVVSPVCRHRQPAGNYRVII